MRLTVAQLIKQFCRLMKPESALLSLKQAVTGPYPQLAYPLHTHTLYLFKIHYKHNPVTYAKVFQVAFFPSRFSK
jgi:hypothetical protein